VWQLPRGRALLEKAGRLGVVTEDLLASDREQVAWKAIRDFDVNLNGVTASYKEGQLIIDANQIDQLKKRNSPVISLEPELQRRVVQAQEHRRLVLLAVVSAIASALSAGAAWLSAFVSRGSTARQRGSSGR
jgi:hypothetical protein